uniref:Ubiquitin-like domain-containing protein n=1 Tax=Salarias fasciatus TaxID=181472 RepID=A0A672FGW8_SALFA
MTAYREENKKTKPKISPRRISGTVPEGFKPCQQITRDLDAKMGLQIKVHGPRGEKKIIDLCEKEEQLEKMSVLLLKKIIVQQLSINGDLRLVFHGETMEESSMLSTYSIKHMSTIYMILVLPGGH